MRWSVRTDYSVIGWNSERRLGKSPVKEEVGAFTTDIVVVVRKPEPCGTHDGPSRLDSRLIGRAAREDGRLRARPQARLMYACALD